MLCSVYHYNTDPDYDMKIIDFTTLTIGDQLHLLHTDGVFLSKRKIGRISVLLYQLDQLYVEIFYTKHRRQVSRIHCTRQPEVLLPYLDGIAIDDLFDN